MHKLKLTIFLMITTASMMQASEKQSDFAQRLEKIFEQRSESDRQKTFGEYFHDKFKQRMEDLGNFRNSQKSYYYSSSATPLSVLMTTPLGMRRRPNAYECSPKYWSEVINQNSRRVTLEEELRLYTHRIVEVQMPRIEDLTPQEQAFLQQLKAKRQTESTGKNQRNSP